MKISLFGYEMTVKKSNDLSLRGAAAKRAESWRKIEAALAELQRTGQKMSEYRIQKAAGVSINTVKRYRDKIAEWKREMGVSGA